MTATTSAASNGGTTPASAPERLNGIARVKDAEAYHMASVAHDAAFEAERLCSQIYRAASDAYLRDAVGPATAAEAVESPAMQDNISEALRCLVATENYLRSLSCGEPPF
jgi:hypothetical protein